MDRFGDPIRWIAVAIAIFAVFFVTFVASGSITVAVATAATGLFAFSFTSFFVTGADIFARVVVIAIVIGATAAIFATVSVAAAIAICIAFIVLFAIKRIVKKNPGFLFSIAHLLIMMALTLWLIYEFREPGRTVNGILLWTVFVFLSGINALFDVASLQLSRWFLTQIKEHDRYLNIFWTVLDVLVAIALLIGLYGTIFLCLEAVDNRLFPELQLFTVARWRELLWEQRDWLHPEILWLTLMASTTLIVTVIHLVFAFAHLFVPLWHRRDREKITGLIRAIREKATAHPEKKVPEADCRRLATAYYFPWEHGIVLGTLTLWMVGYLLYTLITPC